MVLSGLNTFTNTGTLDLTDGDATMTFSGQGAGFSSPDGLTVGAGGALIIESGPFVSTTVSGTGTLTLRNTSVIDAALTVSTGSTVILDRALVTASLDNQGTVEVINSSSVSGALTTSVGSTLRINAVEPDTLTVASGFTSNGRLELTSQFGNGATLTLSSGMLTNAATGTIATVTGPGGGRDIDSDLDNGGTVELETNLRLNGQLIDLAGGSSSYSSNGAVLNTAGLDLDGVVFDNMPLVSTGGALTRFANVTFQNMDVTATQLTINHPGPPSAFLFSTIDFMTTPMTGLYLEATDTSPTDGNVLTIDLTNTTPDDGSGLTGTDGGAVVSWLDAAPAFSLATNGVTIVCTDAQVGATGTVNGVVYTKRSEAEIRALVGVNDALLPTTCTSGVANMQNMFSEASAFNQDIGSWDVSSVTNMRNMFYEAFAFNQDISSWDVSNVTTMFGMISRATAFDQDIGSWNVSSVTNTVQMFVDAVAFNQPIGGWNVSSVTDMTAMFDGASAFNQDISLWDVSSVTSMWLMFRTATAFNQPISSWDVSSVTDMAGMFVNATSFNQDLGRWCVTLITTAPSSFDSGATAWGLPRPVWGTCLSGWALTETETVISFDLTTSSPGPPYTSIQFSAQFAATDPVTGSDVVITNVYGDVGGANLVQTRNDTDNLTGSGTIYGPLTTANTIFDPMLDGRFSFGLYMNAGTAYLESFTACGVVDGGTLGPCITKVR